MVSIPHLQVKARWDLVFSLIPGKHGLLFGDDDLLLSHEIVKGVHEAPVEVPLPSDGMVVDVCVLLVLLLSLQPAVTGRRCEAKRRVSTQSSQKNAERESSFYPRTNMSLDFSPVKMSSSSRTTSSVFQMITLSSNLPWDEMRKRV